MKNYVWTYDVEISEDKQVYLLNGVEKPTIFMRVGDTVIFKIDTKGYPFYITQSPLGNEGTRSIGIEEGILEFKAVDIYVDKEIFYQCTSEPKMGYKIIVSKDKIKY